MKWQRGLGPLLVMMLIGATLTVPGGGAASTTLRFVADTGSAGPTESFQKFDGIGPKLFDFNGDGRKEIVAQNDNQWVYVFDSSDGRLLAEMKTSFPGGWGARTINGPEAAILDDGQLPRIIVANSAAVITSYRYNPGSSSPGHFGFTKEWERRLSDCFGNPGMDAKPVLADLDNDGVMEIIGTTEESGVYALRANGDLYWKNCVSGGNGEPGIADLDQDGRLDVVHVSDGGLVAAFNGRTGGWMWGLELKQHFDLGSGSIPVGPGIGQLDGQGGPDIVVGARDSHEPDNWDENHALLAAISSGGSILWGAQDPNGNPLTYTHPAVVDADGDGVNEIYWGDWNTNGHKPPFPSDPDYDEEAWQLLGPGNFYRYDNHGNRVWKQSLNTYWSNKDIAIADVDGDGTQEMLANGPSSGDGIWYLNGQTGAKETFIGTHPWKVSRGPVVGDLDGNGGMQWVVQVEAATNSVSGGGIMVFNTNAPYSAAWPHMPDPGDAEPGSGGGGGGGGTPPPSGETFDATFKIKSPNEWWQEVYVDADEPRSITSVEIRVNGGSWLGMDKRAWGAWTSSHHTTAGTQVEFRAWDNSGAVSVSAPFTWMDGTTSRRSTDSPSEPPPSGEFDATFRVPDSVNEWWIEVDVDSTQIIDRVAATVNGGGPYELSKRSWGNWAVSTHTPQGSQVQFTAYNRAGDTASSQTFTWLGGDGGDGGDGGTGEFDPTFRLSSGVNEWWVEVFVDSSRAVTAVDAQVNGGDWRALEKKSWGAWAKSFHVPSGSQVVFRATDSGGDQATSQSFAWLGGSGDGGDGGSGAFEPTFTPKAVGNDWWIEVDVDGSGTATGVDVRLNEGAWQALDKKSWGNWAKSLHAPDGTQVQFRATDGSTTVQSSTYTWA